MLGWTVVYFRLRFDPEILRRGVALLLEHPTPTPYMYAQHIATQLSTAINKSAEYYHSAATFTYTRDTRVKR